MRRKGAALLSPGGIALVYLAFGLLGLAFSDVLLPRLVDDPALLREYQAVKGALEVLLTAGLIYGLVSLYRRSAERKTREVERARDRFAFLNNLLRHHVLNRMNVVEGYVDEMLSQGDADPDRLRTVRRQSEAVVDLVDNVRALAHPPEAGYETRPVDLTALLEAEVESAREAHPAASVTADVPSGLVVEADDSAALVFENLLENAIQHNDAESPSVRVSVDLDGDRVRVRVADDGPGIPEAARSPGEVAERRGHEGTGLFLVETLVERYGGSVDIEESPEGGAEVVVELRRAAGNGSDERPAADPGPDADGYGDLGR